MWNFLRDTATIPPRARDIYIKLLESQRARAWTRAKICTRVMRAPEGRLTTDAVKSRRTLRERSQHRIHSLRYVLDVLHSYVAGNDVTCRQKENAETRRDTSRHVEDKFKSAARLHCQLTRAPVHYISRHTRNISHSLAIFCRSTFSTVLLSNRDWVSDTFRSDLNVVHVASSFSLLPLLSPSRLVPLYLLSPLAPLQTLCT